MRWKVLISSAHLQSRLHDYRDLFKRAGIEIDIITRPQYVPEEDLLEIIEPYHAIVCSDDEITDRVLKRAKNLKAISKWGVGVNSIDVEAAKRHGIDIYNSPGAFSESCATMVFSYLLHFARNVVQQDRSVRSGRWEHVPGFALAGKTMGIIGMGNIGKAVAKRAAAFDMNVIGHDIKEVDQEFLSTHGISVTSKEDLLRQSDFVVLATDLNPTSIKLMGAKEFSLMKPTAYLFNTARGPIVDEKALIAALKKKSIAGAGLDVFEKEPLPKSSPLLKMKNVILTPHNAYNTKEAEDYVHDNTVKNLIKGLKKIAGLS